MALCQETQKEDRHPSLPGSGVLASTLRHMRGVMEGVAHSPLVKACRAREGAQRWGTYMSLTSPPIRQYKPDYYKVHYSADIPESEVLQPQQLWSTSSFLAIAKCTPPTDFRIRNSPLRDWKGLQRASLGVINHLDWFLSTCLEDGRGGGGRSRDESKHRQYVDVLVSGGESSRPHAGSTVGWQCCLPQGRTAGRLSYCAPSQSMEPTCSQARSRRHSEWPPRIGTNSSSSRQRSSRLGGICWFSARPPSSATEGWL